MRNDEIGLEPEDRHIYYEKLRSERMSVNYIIMNAYGRGRQD